MTTDPEVISLQGMSRGMEHFDKKKFTILHLRVFVIVGMLVKVTNGRGYPQARHIGRELQMPDASFRTALRELVESRYIHEIVPPYGPLDMTYKMGAAGGLLMKTMMQEGKLKPTGETQHGRPPTEDEETGQEGP